MGTRHLVAVCINGTYPIAQYGQWDGYPSGQGLTVLDFLNRKIDRETFIEKTLATVNADEDWMMKEFMACGHDGKSEFVTMDVSMAFSKKHPQLSRDAGAEILSMVQDGPYGLPLMRRIEFAGDGLFCEWGYVIDFDKNTLEVYQGFQDQPLTPEDRFYGFKSPNGYHPIKLMKSWSLDKIPSKDEFLAALEPQKEEA